MTEEAVVHRFPARDGARLAYREIGEGRPVVLIHGFLTNAVDAWIRTGHAEELARRGLRAVMPDLRGHGESVGPVDANAYPPDVLVDDGLALVEGLGLDDFALAGYSLGGRVALRMMVRGALPTRAVVGGQGLDSVTAAEGHGAGSILRRIVASPTGFAPGSLESRIEEHLRRNRIDPAPLLRLLDSLVVTPSAELDDVETPTLVLCGAEDPRDGRALAAALPRGEYIEMPGDHEGAAIEPTGLGAEIAGFLSGRSTRDEAEERT